MRLLVAVTALLQIAVGGYVQMPYPNPAGVTIIDRYNDQSHLSYAGDSDFNGYSYPEPAFKARFDLPHVAYAAAQVPATAPVPVISHVPTVARVPVTRIASHHGVLEQHVDVLKPALSTRKFEVRRPAIQKHFYDIEEHVVVRPAGSAVVELDEPTSKLQKGPAVITPLNHAVPFFGHHLISGAHDIFNPSVPSNVNFADFPSSADSSLIPIASTPATPLGDEDSEIVDNFDYLNQPEANPEMPQNILPEDSGTVISEPPNELPGESQTSSEPPTNTDLGSNEQIDSSINIPSNPSEGSTGNSDIGDSSNASPLDNSTFNGYPSHSDSIPGGNAFSSLSGIPSAGHYQLIGSPLHNIAPHGSHFSSYQIFHISSGKFPSSGHLLQSEPSNESPVDNSQSQDFSSSGNPQNNIPFDGYAPSGLYEGYPSNNDQFQGYPPSGQPISTSPATSPPPNNQILEPTPGDYPASNISFANNAGYESNKPADSMEASSIGYPSNDIQNTPSTLYLPSEENNNDAIAVKLRSQEGFRKRIQQKVNSLHRSSSVIPRVRLTPEQTIENQNRLIKLVTGRGGITEIVYGTDRNASPSISYKENRQLPFGYRITPLRSRVLSATESKGPQVSEKSATGQRVSTRRVVVNRPVETLEEVEVHEPINQVARVTVRTPTFVKTAHVDHVQVHGTTPVLEGALVPSVAETHIFNNYIKKHLV